MECCKVIDIWQTIMNVSDLKEKINLKQACKLFYDTLFSYSISVITYNILAQRFITPYINTRYKHIDDLSILEWPYRLNLIHQEIKNHDIICLQEVELNEIANIMTLFPTYQFWHHTIEKKRTSPVGNLIMWNSKIFTYVAVKTTSCAVIVSLIHMTTGFSFSLMNIHLRAGLKSKEHERINQIKSCMKQAKSDIPMCICGDFNDLLLPNSPVREILETNKFIISSSFPSCYVSNGDYDDIIQNDLIPKYLMDLKFFAFDHIVHNKLNIKVFPCPNPQKIPTIEYPSDHYPRIFKILI